MHCFFCFGLIFLRSALRVHSLIDLTPQERQYHPKKAMGNHISVTFSNLENNPLKPKWPLPLPPYQPLFRQPNDHLTSLPRRKKDLFWGPRDKGKTKTSCGIFKRGAEPCSGSAIRNCEEMEVIPPHAGVCNKGEPLGAPTVHSTSVVSCHCPLLLFFLFHPTLSPHGGTAPCPPPTDCPRVLPPGV